MDDYDDDDDNFLTNHEIWAREDEYEASLWWPDEES